MIEVSKEEKEKVGSCVVCSDEKRTYRLVYVVQIGTMKVRLCETCRKELSRQLNMARHW